MSPHDDRDRRLAELISGAVERIEPRERLAEIRRDLHPTPHVHSAPHAKETAMSTRRPWSYALLGAVGTAAVVAAAFFAGGQLGADDSPPTDPATSTPTASQTPESPEPTTPSSTDATEEPSRTSETVAVYYVGDTERAGPRLYREFRRLSVTNPLDGAVNAALGTGPDGSQIRPLDPDYRTAWPAMTSADASFDGSGSSGLIQIDLGGDPESGLRERPPGMSEAEARAAVQQLIYTAQAAVQTRAPVEFLIFGERADQVLGVPASEPLTAANALDVLSHVSITTPEQGATVGDSLELTGRANSFEANVGWEIRRGGDVVEEGFATAEGWMGEKLFPFATTIPVGDLAPGDYTIWVTTGDPSGGTEGIGPMTDSKAFTVQ